jgi:hypothetical protein
MLAWMVQHVAAMASADGVDVDATSPVGAWLAARLGTSERPYIPVRSIWLPVDGLRSTRNQRLLESVVGHQPENPPTLVLVQAGANSVKELTRGLIPAQVMTQDCPVAVGLPSSALRGGRPHLVQLGAVRRFAEEWELKVALDLSGRFDPTWEAEAAVARIGERLTLLRMPMSAPSRAAVGRDRVACRALHAAIDRSPMLDVALSSLRPMPFPVTPRAAASGIQRAARYVDDRAAIHAEALREGISRYEGSHSPRGG